MKPNRMATFGLLLIFLFVAMEYSWLQTPHAPGASRWSPRLGPMRSGCPADPAQRKDLGATDYRFSIKTLNGVEVSFSQFRGKPIFLNVWATWCSPCVKEMPDIQALADSLQQEDIAFVLLSEESLDEVKQFVTQEGLHAPVYVATGALPEVFDSRGIPATFLIDTQGTIVARRIGAAGWDNDTCRNYLRGMLPAGTSAVRVIPVRP